MDGFSGGYFKALLDVYNLLIKADISNLNSKRKYERFVQSLLALLITNGDAREDIMCYGSNIDYWNTKLVIEQDGKVIYDEKRSPRTD